MWPSGGCKALPYIRTLSLPGRPYAADLCWINPLDIFDRSGPVGKRVVSASSGFWTEYCGFGLRLHFFIRVKVVYLVFAFLKKNSLAFSRKARKGI